MLWGKSAPLSFLSYLQNPVCVYAKLKFNFVGFFKFPTCIVLSSICHLADHSFKLKYIFLKYIYKVIYSHFWFFSTLISLISSENLGSALFISMSGPFLKQVRKHWLENRGTPVLSSIHGGKFSIYSFGF